MNIIIIILLNFSLLFFKIKSLTHKSIIFLTKIKNYKINNLKKKNGYNFNLFIY